MNFYGSETFSSQFRVGRSHFGALKKRFFLSKKFAKFHNFVFLCSTDFGPDSFGRKYDLCRIFTLKGWAEVSV